jgi:hypothetical protein
LIIRRHHTANFTTIGNALFDDERLQADEVGILAYLLSRPDNWEVRRPALMRRWKIGRDALRRIITNLVRHGWATACRKRLDNGTYYTIYEIRDEHGPSLTEDEVKRAFSLESNEGVTDENEGNETDFTIAGNPSWSADNPQSTYALPDAVGPPRLYKKTNPDLTKDRMGEARARGQNSFTDGSKALAAAFWTALGFDGPLDIPPEFAGLDWRALKWEQAGWTVDLIGIEARRIAAQKPLKPLSYFEKVFATSFAKRQTPLPVVEIREAEKLTVTSHGRPQPQGGNIIQAADRLVEKIRAFDAGPDDADHGLCDRAGEAAVRLLPQRGGE